MLVIIMHISLKKGKYKKGNLKVQMARPDNS